MYTLRHILLLCCLGVILTSRAHQWHNVIHVNPTNGTNTTRCGSASSPCKNISYALKIQRKPSTMFILSPRPDVHYLDNTIYRNPFKQDGIGMTTNGSAVVECHGMGPNAGLSFINASNIVLERITFSHCAALQNSTSQNFDEFITGGNNLTMIKLNASLYFYLCVNVTVDQVHVTDSPNATGVVMFDVTGSVTFTESNFTKNHFRTRGKQKNVGGGGVYIEFTYCLPGDNNCEDDKGSYTSHNSHSHYKFTNCTFDSNVNREDPGTFSSAFLPPKANVHSAFGRGGGLSIFLKGNATNNIFEISNCTFKNNTAMWGGGLGIYVLDKASGNQIMINHHCSFTSNWLWFTHGSSGGGMDIFYFVRESQAGNNITVDTARFFNNSGSSGGGLSMVAARQNYTGQTAVIQLRHTKFVENKAGVGAAAIFSRYMVTLHGKKVTVEFSNCTFIKNSLVSGSKRPYLEGVGTIYTNKLSVNFRDKMRFSHNIGSALGVTGTYIDFSSCNAAFYNNTGYQGGAIALLGAAYILLDNFTSMQFHSNRANTKGGAIYNKYIEKEDLGTLPNCFFNHVSPFQPPGQWNNPFNFTNNYAGLHGHSIYATSILPCATGIPDKNASRNIFCLKNWSYTRNGSSRDCHKEIGSDIGRVIYNNTNPLLAFPGKGFPLSVHTFDDLNHNTTEKTVYITSTSSNITSVPTFPYQPYFSAQLYGEGNYNTVTLVLDTVSERVWHINVLVRLEPCPPGLKVKLGDRNTSKAASCQCSGHYGKRVTCNSVNYTSTLTNQYWMGLSPHDSQTIVVGLCHNGFCHSSAYETDFVLPNATSMLDESICGEAKRTGILCGQCVKGYAPAVNSDIFQCVRCNDLSKVANFVYYIISVYFPLFALFTVIVLLKVRLTTGPAVAFILYAQVISSTFYPDGDGHIPLNTIVNNSKSMTMAYVRSYGIFNLEFIENFIEPFCLGNDLNTLDVLQLNYIVAVFPLAMIIFVLACMRFKRFVKTKCRYRRGRLATHTQQVSKLARRWNLGDSLLHAFAAFILLSYTKFSLTTSYIATYQPLYDENTKIAGAPRVFLAGQYAMDDTTYGLRYLYPSVLIYAVFVIIPPLLLLHYPLRLLEHCINRSRYLKRLYPADRIHILLDTFQGCYRNNMRFFAGLYFIFRVVLHVTYIAFAGMLVQYTVQQVICTTFAVLVALCRPYTRQFLNYVDTLIFANLAIINSLSLFLSMFVQTNQGTNLPLTPFVIQYILIFLPWVYMILYGVWSLMTPNQHAKIIAIASKGTNVWYQTATPKQEHEQQSATNWLGDTLEDFRNTADSYIIDREIREAPVDDTEALLRRAERENLYRVPQPPRELLFGQTGGEGRAERKEEDDQSGLLPGKGREVSYGSCSMAHSIQ